MSEPESATTPASYEQLLECMRRRRSVRRFRADPVPDVLLNKLLEAARWAPSASNRQPYRILVLRSPPLMARLASVVRAACQRLLETARPERAAALAAYMRYFDWFDGAPLLLVPIYRSQGPELVEGAPSRAAIDALTSTAAMIMNLLLAAHSLGLGACWMTGPLLAEVELIKLLGVPEGWAVAALLPLGYPDESPPPPRRRTIEQLVRYVDEDRS